MELKDIIDIVGSESTDEFCREFYDATQSYAEVNSELCAVMFMAGWLARGNDILREEKAQAQSSSGS